ncbi:MAG: hypothetical protein ACMUIM_06085 [bacterium]
MNSIRRFFLIFILIGCFSICPVILNAALVPIGITSNFSGIASSPFMNYFGQFNSYGSNNLGFTNNLFHQNIRYR